MGETIRFLGKVVSGVGEGARYVALYRRVLSLVLGIDPYPGTLNIDVGRNVYRALVFLRPRVIPPPSRGYRPVLAYRARVSRNGVYVDGYIVVPCVTVHGENILEFIAETSVREKLGLSDGDEVEVLVSE